MAIDLARGIAVGLMILSHGVKGLLNFEQIPAWGLVPIHLITKFSSSLFIIVFGISLGVAFVPHIGSQAWPGMQKKLVLRGLVVFFWYKVLTIVEMAPQYGQSEIAATLLYKAFPVYVEILGFYAIALLWIPPFLTVWNRCPRWLRFLSPVAMGAAAYWLSATFDFWGLETLKAILVEDERHYAWGQLSRGPLVLIGLLIGDELRRTYWERPYRWATAWFFAACSTALFAAFFATTMPGAYDHLLSIAKNEGKHPPDADFMLFSLGGAFFVLFVTTLGGERLALRLRHLTDIGKVALQAFVFHIIVLFICYRFLFGYWHSVSYPFALSLTAVLFVLTALWVKLSRWLQSSSRPPSS